MDKIVKYQNIVAQVLQKHIGLPSPHFPAIKDLLIIDADKRHFILLSMGWHKQNYIHQITFHIEVKPKGQVWIHENRTDVLIDEELVEKGVEAKDLTAGMLEDYSQTGLDSQAA